MNIEKTLFLLKEGERAKISQLKMTGGMKRRLRDIGFSEGSEVMCMLKRPFGDPSAYLIKGAVIALRQEDSMAIEVE